MKEHSLPTPLGSVHISFPLRPEWVGGGTGRGPGSREELGSDSGVGCFKGLATGEADELLGDMDPLEMEIKWLHSPMMKIADAMENKTTVYKVPVPFLHGNPLLYPGLWGVVGPFCLVSTRYACKGGECRSFIHSPWALWASGVCILYQAMAGPRRRHALSSSFSILAPA